jgi:N6-L-threonylcarbamoyladenine synthase
MEKLALCSDKSFSPKVCVKDGNCCLSGVENLCSDMLDSGESREDIAAFCLAYVGKTIEKMAQSAKERYGNLPMIFAGGVSSDSIIRKNITEKFGACFAQPDYSCDNAAGTALLAYKRGKLYVG